MFLIHFNLAVTYRYCVFCGGIFNRWEGDFVRSLQTTFDETTIATYDTYGLFSAPLIDASRHVDGRASAVTASKIKSFKASDEEEGAENYRRYSLPAHLWWGCLPGICC